MQVCHNSIVAMLNGIMLSVVAPTIMLAYFPITFSKFLSFLLIV